MTSWERDADVMHPIDYRLVQNSFVTLFCDRAVLDETLGWLVEHGYDVVEVDAGLWATEDAMFRAIGQALDFPSYFGRNLNALDECLSDVASGEYGRRADGTGLVLVLTNFERFVAVDRGAAQALLDVFARCARGAMLMGNRLICLVQSNDPAIRFEPVGATRVDWNGAEWLNTNRHPAR